MSRKRALDDPLQLRAVITSRSAPKASNPPGSNSIPINRPGHTRFLPKMPISRKKSCVRCREAKARCNQAQPLCSRCADRGLRCIYEGDVRTAPYPAAPSAPGSANAQFLQQLGLSDEGERGGLGGLADGMLPGFDGDDCVLWAPTSMDNTPTFFTLEKGLLPTAPTFMDTYDLSQGRIPDGQTIAINNPLPTLASPPLTNSSSPQCTAQSEATALQHQSQAALNRRPILKHCVLTNILIGQMTSYPRMVIEGESLPPFIHPPCHHGAQEYMAPECGESGSHQCLPETLSICTGLVKMFYTRTERNASFVWSSIYTEARRLRDGVRTTALHPSNSPNRVYSLTHGMPSGSSQLYRRPRFTCSSRQTTPRRQRRTVQLSFSAA